MIEHAGASEQGNVRFRNEDFIAASSPEEAGVDASKGSLFVIADGVGGSGAGDVASRDAAIALISNYYASSRRPEKALQDAMHHANTAVFDAGMRSGKFRMETTVSALLLVGGQAHIIHAGDSRIYRIRGAGNIVQLTQDHSEVAELVKMQLLTPEKARHHPRRNVITKSVGSSPLLHPMKRTEPLQAGDIFVMCTDGLWEPVSDLEMAHLSMDQSPSDACRSMIKLGLERQSTDNLSVHVVKVITVAAGEQDPPGYYYRWWNRLATIFHRRESNQADLAETKTPRE